MTKSILIIDDETNVRTTLADILKLKGFKVAEASGGEDGLKKVADMKPNVVLLDINMSDMDGYEVCHKIKEMDGCEAKVVIYTGAALAVDYDKAKVAGADEYAVKTDDFSLLLEVLEKFT